jgi:hypothetical protein
MLKRWEGFTRFLENGRICLINNAAERAVHGLVLGRKSWLFAGSERGADRAAVMYTLIATARPGSPTCLPASPTHRRTGWPMSCRGKGRRDLQDWRHESSGNLWLLPSEPKDGSHFWLSKLKEGSGHETLCRTGPVDGNHAGLHCR